jgi:hypothetical protein
MEEGSRPKVVDIPLKKNKSEWKPSIFDPANQLVMNHKKMKQLSRKTQDLLENLSIRVENRPVVGHTVSLGSISLPAVQRGKERCLDLHSKEQFLDIHKLMAF